MVVFLKLALLGMLLAVHTIRGNPITRAFQNTPPESIVEARKNESRDQHSSFRSAKNSLVKPSSSPADFQQFGSLEVKGSLDDDTVENTPGSTNGGKSKRRSRRLTRWTPGYLLQGSYWTSKNLKYKIEKWPSSLKNRKQEVRKAIRDAFKAWTDVSGLTIWEVPITSKAEIVIIFVKGKHGECDAKPFDGPGKTLAHAFYPDAPTFPGDAHFDDSENWKLDLKKHKGPDLFTVAVHEFGHSLGLMHSFDDNAVMSPLVDQTGGSRDILTRDDILGIQDLYGPPNQSHPVPEAQESLTSANVEKPDATLCTDSSVDAMVTLDVKGEKRTYVFKGKKYWRLTRTGVEKGYPRLIVEMWGGVSANLDAILADEESNKTYFFKKGRYWRMTNLKMDAGYPKPISVGFSGIPNDIDAAFKWTDGKMYFFKNSQYWRFDAEEGATDQSGVTGKYPQRISNWKGIPVHNNIDSVLTHVDNEIYFFKGKNYYRFTGTDVVDLSYPRSTGQSWFGCSK